MTANEMYQDNKSAILLEKNGKSSSGHRTKHINLQYFFLTDLIKMGEMSIDYCPTGDMLGVFLLSQRRANFLENIAGTL